MKKILTIIFLISFSHIYGQVTKQHKIDTELQSCLDSIQNYTTYATYFELIENEKALPGHEVEKAKARGLLLKHVGRHPHTIESKARIMLDHRPRQGLPVQGRACSSL